MTNNSTQSVVSGEADIASIIVEREDRQRRDVSPEATKDLRDSIAARGLMQPIVVSREARGLVLLAGERRLVACQALGYTTIPYRLYENLPPLERKIIEFEENFKRRDFTWQESAQAIARIHALHCELDDGWTLGETASAIGMTSGNVSLNMRVAQELVDTRIAECDGLREAYNVITRREQRAVGDALEDLLTDPLVEPDHPDEPRLPLPASVPGAGNVTPATAPAQAVPESILQADFRKWAKTFQGKRFNFIHCDFPYGQSELDGPQAHGSEYGAIDSRVEGRANSIRIPYENSAKVYDELLDALLENLDSLFAVSGHLMFWLSAKPCVISETLAKFAARAPSVSFDRQPLIWLKSDNAGVSPDAARRPRHVYETCLFGSRGARNLVKIKANAYAAPTDKRFHISTKPEPMLKHFFEMIVDEQTRVLDPTCGSGAALRAAEALGARYALGLEIDKQCVELARQVLRTSRATRQAAASVK